MLYNLILLYAELLFDLSRLKNQLQWFVQFFFSFVWRNNARIFLLCFKCWGQIIDSVSSLKWIAQNKTKIWGWKSLKTDSFFMPCQWMTRQIFTKLIEFLFFAIHCVTPAATEKKSRQIQSDSDLLSVRWWLRDTHAYIKCFKNLHFNNIFRTLKLHKVSIDAMTKHFLCLVIFMFLSKQPATDKAPDYCHLWKSLFIHSCISHDYGQRKKKSF